MVELNHFKDTLIDVRRPYPSLADASVKYVAYAYSLGTDDGFSQRSPWTQWILVNRKDSALQLPVITLKDGGYFVETKRRVYRDVLKEDMNAQSRQPGHSTVEVATLLAKELTNISGLNTWIDSEPDR
jgi:hypothetical protein